MRISPVTVVILGLGFTTTAIALSLHALADHPPLNGDSATLFLFPVAGGAVVGIAVVALIWRSISDAGAQLGGRAALSAVFGFPLFGAMFAAGLAVELNALLDFAPARTVVATVLGKDPIRGDDHQILVYARGESSDALYISVDGVTFARAQHGDLLELRLKPGWLREPWVEGYRWMRRDPTLGRPGPAPMVP